jgi:hypothetical protein
MNVFFPLIIALIGDGDIDQSLLCPAPFGAGSLNTAGLYPQGASPLGEQCRPPEPEEQHLTEHTRLPT